MAEVITIECQGLACPQPVIKTKKALDSITQGTVEVLVDNETARENVLIFARNAGFKAEAEKAGEDYRITIIKGSPGAGPQNTPPTVAAGESDSVVYLITTNMLGQGSADLGQVLIESLAITLSEMDPPPKAMLFLNSGVFLTCQGSTILDQLQSLSSRGTEIISCGTCLNYYRLKEKLAVGRIGNMMEINNLMLESGKVVTIP